MEHGREVAAALKKDYHLPEYENAADAGNDVDTRLQIISETEKCPHFYGKVVGSVTIKESPRWMKNLLRASGMHSINNVVDISNIVMLETGQPMHFMISTPCRRRKLPSKTVWKSTIPPWMARPISFSLKMS